MDYSFGDTSGKLVGKLIGSDSVMSATLDSMNLVGDAYFMTGISTGGTDLLYGLSDLDDGYEGKPLECVLIGDALTMTGYSTGGNDYIYGGMDVMNIAYGDALIMEGNSRGGDDYVSADTIAQTNMLFGDADTMTQSSVGGNDQLRGGFADSVNFLVGDSYTGDAGVYGGDDSLYSWEGSDHMWGDFVAFNGDSTDSTHFGQDVFIFFSITGEDYIYDFHRGEDKINLVYTPAKSMDDLTKTVSEGNLVLNFENNVGSITLIGIDSLNEDDFIFAPA